VGEKGIGARRAGSQTPEKGPKRRGRKAGRQSRLLQTSANLLQSDTSAKKQNEERGNYRT